MGVGPDVWAGLDEIDWAGLKHNYGSAEDVPGLLRRCAGPDEGDAHSAAGDLDNHLFHQGGWICPAAPAALPFLLRLAAAPSVPTRRPMLELVASLAGEPGRVRAERFVDPGWAPAWQEALPDVLGLLGDPLPEIRRGAAYVLAVCQSPGEAVLPALLRCWAAEGDPATRLELVLALGAASVRMPAGGQGAEARDLLHGLLDSPEPQTRLAAVHALAPGDPDLPAGRLDLVLDAARDPGVEVWRHVSSVGTGVPGVHGWTADLYPGPDPAYVLGLLADHHDGDQRTSALAQAGTLLSRWRSPTAALLPRIAARLGDPLPEVRFRAAELLACLGPAAAAHADEVAALRHDTAARDTRTGETVGEAALWALARMDDPRCVPGLVPLVGGAPSGFASASNHFPDSGGHYVNLPALHEVLAELPGHTDLFLPAVRARLRTETDGFRLRRLCEALADWGPRARAAVPELLALLADERTWQAAAPALAGVGLPDKGRAVSRVRKRLLARSRTEGPDAGLAAWAYWKVTGEPGPALEALRRDLEERRYAHPSVRRLADLGPHAAPYAELFEALTSDRDAWTRVEAAHALWAATGDTATAAPVLTAAARDLAEGTYLPVMLPALGYLAALGPAARPAAELLRDLPARDRRLRSNGGWRGFVQDEQIRTAVEELLRATGPSASPEQSE